MGYGRALLQRDVRQEEEAFQKKAKKKSLWGSIGRTLGGLAVMGLTGGAVNPLTVGLLTGGASFLGGAIGAKAAGGKLTGGKFFQADRKSPQKELGAFGTQNLVSSLTSGITAGIGQKLKLMKAGAPEAAKLSEGFGLDFEGSMVGKGLEKRAIGKELVGYGEASIGTGDVSRGKFAPGEMTSKIYDADPSLAPTENLQYSDRTVTDTYGSREGGEYFFEDTPKVSAWDKFKDFVDVSDVVEERDLMSQIESVQGSSLSQYGPHSEFTARNQGWTPPGMGYKKPFSVLSKEFPGRRKSGLSNVIR